MASPAFRIEYRMAVTHCPATYVMSTELEPKTLFVKNIPYQTTREGLKKVFEKYGPLQMPRILQDRFKGRFYSRGIGFVEFDTVEAFQAAMKDKDNLECEGRKLVVNQARQRAPRRRDTVFVGGLPEGCTADDLKAAVAKYNPLDAKVVTLTGNSFGFIKMATPEDQEKVVKENKTVTIKDKQCILRFAYKQFDAPARTKRGYRRGPRRAPRQANAAPAQGGK